MEDEEPSVLTSGFLAILLQPGYYLKLKKKYNLNRNVYKRSSLSMAPIPQASAELIYVNREFVYSSYAI